MKLFIYEWVSCQSAELPASLRREGAAMLAAVLEDAARLPDASVCTLIAGDDHGSALTGRAGDVSSRWKGADIHRGLTPPARQEAAVRRLAPDDDERAVFHELSSAADFTFVIAPETGGLLHQRRDWAEQSGSSWLGCSARAIALTTDKLALGEHLREAGVPTPNARVLARDVPADLFPAVHKPRDGAGAQATFLARDGDELAAGCAAVRGEGWHGGAILQRFAPGQAASVALLVGSRGAVPLLPAAQKLSGDGRFRYLGGRIPLPVALADRACRLALRAAQTVPGLLGYVGVDLVLGEAADGSCDQVIEINTRLTTSYVGLRALTSSNLFAALLGVCRGETPAPLTWHAASVDFDAAGNVRIRSASERLD